MTRQGQLLADSFLARFQRDQIRHRVTDVADGNPGLFVQRRLHRKKRQHTIDRPADLLDPPAAPGPDRRADVVNGTDAGGLEIRLQPEVEIGCIDSDKEVRLEIEQALFQLPADPGNLAVMLECIPVTHDRQFFHRPPAVEPLRLHFWAANAIKHHIGQLLFQRLDQLTGQQVAGGFSGHHGNTKGTPHISG